MVLCIERGDLCFDARRERQTRGSKLLDTRREIVGDGFGGMVLVAVHHDEQRAIRQELIALQGIAVELVGRQHAQGPSILKNALHPLETIAVGGWRVLLPRTCQEAFDQLEIGQDALVRECTEVP